jgi:hypothetical protein
MPTQKATQVGVQALVETILQPRTEKATLVGMQVMVASDGIVPNSHAVITQVGVQILVSGGMPDPAEPTPPRSFVVVAG